MLAFINETRCSAMEQAGYIEHGGAGRGTFWRMQPDLYYKLSGDQDAYSHARIGWDVAKTRVLSVLNDRKHREKTGLSNQDIRQITRFSRSQVHRLMTELRSENPQIKTPGKGKYARYELDEYTD